MKVLWLTNIPSPYRVDFFNELGKQCELTVLFEKRAAKGRDNSWKKFDIKNFKAVFLKGISCGEAEAFCPSVVGHLSSEKYDKIVVTNYSDPTGFLAVSVMRMKKIPYIIESDGGFAGSGKGFRERAKKWVFKEAELCFSTSHVHDDYYEKYGVAPEKIARYPFTSLRSSDVLDKPVTNEQKQELRAKLGISEQKVIVSVGQFIRRKGFDVLIDAMAGLDESTGCYIIGGEPTEEYIKQVDDFGLNNVHFVGFKAKDDLAEYYMAADLFVLPTREDIWGLVVNEAMAKGLPVITTDRCISGITLIASSDLGKIVPVDDTDALTYAIKETLSTLNKELNEGVLRAIRSYTVEKMAKRHIEIWSKNEEIDFETR